MDRKSNTDNFNPFPISPNNNTNHIPVSENEKFNKLFWNNNNSSKLIASKIINQSKNSYSSNPNKNKIMFPNKINELGDLNFNDSLSEIKLNSNLDPKNKKINPNNNNNPIEIKSYIFKEKDNSLNKNKYCSNIMMEKDSYNKTQLKGNKLNNLTDESLIALNNYFSIKNNINSNVNFNFNSNSKDKNSKAINKNMPQNTSSCKVKSNEFSRVNAIDKENKPSIDLNKLKDSQNKKIDNNILKNFFSKNYNNIKVNNNSYLFKNEYMNIGEKIKNKLTTLEKNTNFNYAENMNRSLEENNANRISLATKKITSDKNNSNIKYNNDQNSQYNVDTDNKYPMNYKNSNKEKSQSIPNSNKNQIALQILKIEKLKDNENHLTRNQIKETMAYNSEVYTNTSFTKSNTQSPNKKVNEANPENKNIFLKINNVKRNNDCNTYTNKIKSSNEIKDKILYPNHKMVDTGNFKLSFSKDSYLDSDKKLKKNVIFVRNEVKNRINIKNILKDSTISNTNNNGNKISSLTKPTKSLPNALSETSESTKIQKNSDKNSLVTDLTNKTNPEISQTQNPCFKFSSSNSIICNNINNFIKINNTNKPVMKTNQTKTITNNLNNHCFSNPTLINGNLKNAFSLEKKNTNSYHKINPPLNKLNNLKNSIGNHIRVKNHEISNEEKSEIIKDRSNVLSDQIKKKSSKISYENFNNYSSLHKNNYKESKIINDIIKAKNNLLEYNYKPFETEIKNKSNILNTNFKTNKFAIPTSQGGIKNNNIVKNHREMDELNKKGQEEKLRYELLAQSNNDNKYKNKSQIIDHFNGAKDKNNIKENDKCPNIINELDSYPSVENSILNKIINFEDASFLKRNEFNTNENTGKLGLKKINSIIKNTKESNLSYDYNKEKILTDFQHNYSHFITNDPSNGKKTKFIDEIFTNSNYNNTDNNINEIENSKLKTISLNKKLNTSIKSLTNDSINSKNNLNDDLNAKKQDSQNWNLNNISNNNDLFPLVQAPNWNTSQIKSVSKKPDSLPNNYKKGENIPDPCFDSDLISYKINSNQNNIPDSSFSSNNKNTSNNKILQLSFTQVNPLDTDINIIENNRDKDREKDKLIINEIFNDETETCVKPTNAFSADNYFNKLSDRTHDKNFNKKTYLEKIALKNVGYKYLINNSKKAKEYPKELQYVNVILNSVNNSKNKIPLATQNVKFNLDKSAGGKNNNPSTLFNKKVPYIQVKKYINKYLNEKSANKQNISNTKDSNSIMNFEMHSAKILNTDPNENTEKTKMKLMKNLDIDVDLNNKIDANITAKQNSFNEINYLNTAELNSLVDQAHFTDSNNKKTIFSDNQLYEFDENYDISNLSSERIPYSKNSLGNNYQIDGSEINFSNHLDRGVFIKENKKPDNNVKDKQGKERPKNSFSPQPHSKNNCENTNENNNNNTILYLSVIEFINRNFKPFEILEIIEKIRRDSIFYLGEMNTKFQIFYSQINLIKNFIEIALQRKELNISSNSNINHVHKENQNTDSYRSHNTGSSDTRSSGNTNNYNYNLEKIIDDENGNYIVKIGDHIDYRYEIISELGQGSFGQALKCYDHKNKEFVCVKIIKNNKKFIKQSKIEISLLEFIQENDPEDEKNIVRILNNFPFRNHNCLVFELLDLNLYDLLKSQDFKGLDNVFIRKIAFQMLLSLNFLKSCSIIHCDLKPENVLLKSSDSYDVKVIDFGSSCFVKERMYSYIQSRFYRAPEIILGISYGLEIDMWSFGCILAELYSGIPIFPGEDETDQLFYMMEYLGVPSINIIKISKKRKMFFNDDFSPKKIQNSRGKVRIPNTKKIYKFLLNSDPHLIDLVEKCLVWEPEKRIKPEEALLHPYILERFQKEVYDIFNFYSNEDYNSNTTPCSNKLSTYSGKNTNDNVKNINLNYINDPNKPLNLLDDKININININSINNCQICTNGLKHSNIDHHNEVVQKVVKNTINNGNYVENEKFHEVKESMVLSNPFLTNSQKEKKKTFLGTYTKNLSSNINTNHQPYYIKNYTDKTQSNINTKNNQYENLTQHTNHEGSNMKKYPKFIFKTHSKINNYLTHHN